MEDSIKYKNWPAPNDYYETIRGILQAQNLVDLAIEYSETQNGLDTWTIRDTQARQDLICLIIDETLELTIEPLVSSAPVEWLINQLYYHISGDEDNVSTGTWTTYTYLQWCMHFRSFGPTIDMAHAQLLRERDTLRYPSLEPLYPAKTQK